MSISGSIQKLLGNREGCWRVGRGVKKWGDWKFVKRRKLLSGKKKRKKESKKLIHKLNTNNIHIFQIFEKIILH